MFREGDWDTDIPAPQSEFKKTKYQHKKVKKVRKKPVKKNLKIEEESESGRFVKIHQDVERNGRKLGKSNLNTNSESDNTAPTRKKSKLDKNQVEGVEPIANKKTKNNAEHLQKKPTEPTVNKNVIDSKNIKNGFPLRDRLVESLKGSRFRFINEQMYKTTGADALKLFKEDPSAYQAYHEGFRHQISQWPMNPLDRIIKNFSKLPADHIVADFGCGEGRLAESITQQVYSLDLVAANQSIIACDMAKTPLETNSINVVVFCLSLMGVNIKDFLLEANRVLKVGGLLKIAEVSSRFDSVKLFIDCVSKCGYTLVNKDITHKLFYFFNFKKAKNVDQTVIKVKDFSLKPCLYKKR